MSWVLNASETRNKLAEMGMQNLKLGPKEFVLTGAAGLIDMHTA